MHDLTGNGNDGALTGQTWSTGKYRSGLTFDGQSYITVPDSSSLDLTTNLTISAWVRPSTNSTEWPAIALKEDQGDLSYSLYSQTIYAPPMLCLGPPSDQYSTCVSGGSVPQGDWTYLAGTYDGSIYKLYANGELVASSSQTMAAGVSTDPLRIGGDSIWGEYFTGVIDELRIYKRALSQSEIQTDMTTPVNDTGPDTTPPSVSITAPTDGANVAGTTDIRANVSDDIEVADVKFLVDGNVVGETNWPPFVVHWDSTTVTAGSHTLTVQATDEASNSTTSSSVTVSVIPNALVAAYNFDEGSGTALNDVTGNGNDATLSGQTWATGKYGTGLSFEGNSYITVADSPLLDLTTGMTLSAWVKPLASSTEWPTIALKEDQGDLSYALYSQTIYAPPMLCLGPPSDQYSTCVSGGSVPQGDWTHLAGTYDGSVYRLYINGELVASASQTMAAGVSTDPLRIGGDSIWGEYLTGIMDDLRIYARPLSQSEIQADMNTPLGTGCDSGVDDGNPCTTDACDSGVVMHTPVAAGTACSDGNACNGLETCNSSATCTSGTPPVVDDGNPCTTDACDSATGVSHTPVSTGTSCGSAPDACHLAPTCDATAICQPGAALATGTVCGDPVDDCHSAPACDASATCSAGGTLPTDDGNPCTTDSCDPSTGVSHILVSAGTACGAAPDACHGQPACNSSGSCQTGAALPVDDGNPCTADSCDPVAGVQHAPVTAGTSCSDGNACNGTETCNGSGACTSGTPPTVDDGNPCTADTCDPATGVHHTPVTAGTSCSDGNACNGNETCDGSGACTAGTPPTVDDGNPCTADSCDPATGVQHAPVSAGTSCSDGNVCNGNETCDGSGACTAGTPPVIDDGNPCTTDGCNPASGPTHTPAAGATCGTAPDNCHAAPTCDASGVCQAATLLAPGTQCAAPTDACHNPGTCAPDGSCRPSAPIRVDDLDACTVDSCNPSTGPVHTPLAAGTLCGPSSYCDSAGDCQVQIPPDPATIAPPVDTTVTSSLLDRTAFLYTGTNPSQTGVAAGTIDARRTSVIRGRALDASGNPLSGVTVQVLNHPELGGTATRQDGMFDLVVNGGGNLVVSFQGVGLLTVQRTVAPKWNDSVVLDDVVMVPVDPNVTPVTLGTSQLSVAAGSTMTDQDGTRRAVAFFPPGTTAQMTFSDGTTAPLDAMSVHITEYTKGPLGPERMPGDLPATSAYTYAISMLSEEAEAAGAKSVLFSQPVPVYVDNFLGFATGTIVPVGSYDELAGRWVPEANGRVVSILSVSGGIAALDVDGSGNPASASTLASLGISDAERTQLTSTYSAGTRLWRVPVSHWSASDANWPKDPQDPHPPAPPPSPPPPPPPPDPNAGCGSLIETSNQILGESISVAGTPLTLSYRSDRVPGRREEYRLHIPITGAAVSGDTTIRYDLQIQVAGRTFQQSFPTTANQEYVFDWDGLDAYGRQLQGSQPVTVELSRVVPAAYTAPATSGNAFGQYSGTGVTLTTDRVRDTYSITTRYDLTIGAYDSRPQQIAGWSFNVHNAYDPIGGVLYFGDGDRRMTGNLGNIVEQFAGIGVPLDNYEGVPAAQAEINKAQAVALAQDGTAYIATGSQQILKVDPKTTIVHRFAGNQSGCSFTSGEGGSALNAGLCFLQDLTVAHDGSLLLVETSQNYSTIRRITADGTIHTVAGVLTSGQSCAYRGDGGLATLAELCDVRSLAEGADGTIYTIEGFTTDGRIRKITPDGIIRTLRTASFSAFIGGGTEGGVALGPDGSVYYTDWADNVVRRVTPDGVDKVFAGTFGVAGYAGDGGPATQAQLNFPDNVVVAPNGIVYIPETQNDAIRVVTPDGIINTLAGRGSGSRNPTTGDGGPALQATFNGALMRSALGPDGALYVSDPNFGEVRRVRSALPGGVLSADFFLPSDDGREVYEFDPHGRHVKTRHALTGGTLWTFGYDAAGRLATLTDGDGNVTTVNRDGAGNPTSIAGPFGHITTLGVDANGFLSSVLDPAGAETDFTYTDGGLMTSRIDPNEGVHSFDWDDEGRLLRDQNAAGGFQTLSRAASPGVQTISIHTAENVLSTYKTETLSNLQERRTVALGIATPTVTLRDFNKQTTTATQPDGMQLLTMQNKAPRWGMTGPIVVQSTSKTPSGISLLQGDSQSVSLSNSADPFSVQIFTDAATTNSLGTNTSYSGSAKTITVTSPAGRTTTTTLDALGRPTQMQVPGLAAVSFVYDGHGRVIATTQDTRTTTNAYDASGNLSSITDALSQIETYDHDPVGRVTARHRADGKIVSYTYDAMGNLTSVTPPGKPTHLFTYTPDNRIATYTAPDAGSGADVTGYTYDLDGHPTTVTRPDGTTVTMGYDSAGRMQTVTLPSGSMTFGYDATTGKLTSVAGPYGANLAYGYDGNLFTSTTWSGTVSGSVSRTYDNFFRVGTETINGQSATKATLGYDNDGLVTSVATPAGSMSLTYDPTAPRLQTTTLGSVTDSRTYDQFGQVATYTAKFGTTVLYDVSYVRDALGRIQQKTETIQGDTKTTEYGYDQVGRLVTVAENGTNVRQYTYDDNGNRTRFDDVQHGTSTTGTYDAQDRLLTYGTLSYTYTRDGALRTKTDSSTTPPSATTYTYDALGNLTHVALPDGRAIDYVIDGVGRRVGKKINGVLQKQWLYADNLRILAELDGVGNVVSRFVWADGTGSREDAVQAVLRRLGLEDSVRRLLRIVGKNSRSTPAYMVKGGALYRITTDRLGTPRLVTNVSTGAVGERVDVDEWGKILNDTSPGLQPFGFAGGLFDADTGLVQFGARDYDSQTGRWTSKDATRFDASQTNLYMYAENDPVNMHDSSGLDAACSEECVAQTDYDERACYDRCAFESGCSADDYIGCASACHTDSNIAYIQCEISCGNYHQQPPPCRGDPRNCYASR
ncbi:MAG TPA: LamG-like jellyroll fold domain-containing protein [Polyangiaceae bacterium]|nr:LamG-like jellyroll fold domain-containing protein [Polyangiaceae bacterium]